MPYSPGTENAPDTPLSSGFCLEIDGLEIGTFTEVSGLTVEVEVETYVEGGVNDYEHKLPGRVKYPNIVLKRGLTKENALVDWFAKSLGSGFREVTKGAIVLFDSKNDEFRRWTFSGAFPVKWSGPQFAASSSDVSVEELEIAHAGFVP